MDVDLSRVRRPSRRFGWIDHRIVADGHLVALDPVETAVYLVLCVVADRHGVSWHTAGTLAAWVKVPPWRVREAVESLARRNLVAVADRYAQVLDLDLLVPAPAPPTQMPAAGTNPTPVGGVPPVEPARDRLAQVSAEVREKLLCRARARLVRVTRGREPSAGVLEAVAAGLLDEEVV